jgi:uroporphyrinogen-III synthase
LHTFDAVMFVSGNAVDYFFASKPEESAGGAVFTSHSAIKSRAHEAEFHETRAFVTGPGSFAALQRAGVAAQLIDAPDLQAGSFDSEALWAVVRERVHSGYRLLIVRGGDSASSAGDAGLGRDWFAAQATAAGASVEFVVAYQRACPRFSAPERALAQAAAVDGSVWLFSSSQAIANLVLACPEQSWQQAKAVATHPRIAQAAQDAGFAVVCESRPTVDALLASIESIQ